MIRRSLFITVLVLVLLSCSPRRVNDFDGTGLRFSSLPVSWDEAIPLGNGMTGVLVWQKEGRLRLSVDRADLWDLRPMGNIGSENWRYSWVIDRWKKDRYGEVQQAFDAPYDQLAAPSKIPAAALEFDIGNLGSVSEVVLDIQKALCTIRWDSGAEMQIFVDADGGRGWYRIKCAGAPAPVLVPPAYGSSRPSGSRDMSSNSLAMLGYDPGPVCVTDSTIRYVQKGWGGLAYSVSTAWRDYGSYSDGCWQTECASEGEPDSVILFDGATVPQPGSFDEARERHEQWWAGFWAKSSVMIPDSVLQRQWYLEMYKLGCVARADAPPISLQAVWTADNGMLPPWKGDFHHDLNTQLSYWPAYSSNHTDLSKGFTNWLWKYRPAFERYTNDYFETDGLNVPGVTTLTGEPMGGWIQYSFGPTVSSWLGHHFYLQWRYSLDTLFLEEEVYPWISKTATYLTAVSVIGDDGRRKLPISSSPEFNDNSREAWYSVTTNYDLSLIRWTYSTAAELALALNRPEEALRWQAALSEWPELAVDDSTGLMIAPGYPYAISHRHFSHLMAVYPLGLLSVDNGPDEQQVIKNSLRNLEAQGPGFWTGYSYAWQGNMYARARKGKEAADALRIFAQCFCLSNSFHVNGDQSGTGKSSFTYRPFTLEGNFAFASGIQEMLMQSHDGVIRVFPAIPSEWKNAGFRTLRAEGAVLVSASMNDGMVQEVTLTAEKGGEVRLINPFEGAFRTRNDNITTAGDTIIISTTAGETVRLRP